jgi:hypothetical protein
MTQHLGTPPRPWAGLETHLYAVSEIARARKASNHATPDSEMLRRRKLAKLSLVLGYLARKRGGASTDAG